MSETPPQKKLKQTVFKFPKKESTSDSKLGETSENNDNVQGPSAHSWKTEVGEGSSKDLKEEVDEKNHKFRFKLNSEIVSVSCTTSMTVLEALNTSQYFETERDKKKTMQIIIKRSEVFLGAAVKTDFPCCLIEKNEILDVLFITNDVDSTNQQTTADPSLCRKKSNPETMVTFCLEKDGGANVKFFFKSNALRKEVSGVCVYAFKGESVKTALTRDGRFDKVIFKKHCGLYETCRKTKYELSNPVEDLDRKTLQVVVLSNNIQPESQDDCIVKSESNVASDADVEGNVGPSQNPSNTEQEKKVAGNTESTNASATRYAAKAIVNSEETLKILRDQYPKLLEILKQRENLRNNSDVQKFFRVEYHKSVENFTEVKKMKQLMKLSDSVCQIRKGGSDEGTGFILFDRFILTNAHVIGIFDDRSEFNSAVYRAVFDYEDRQSAVKIIPVKQIVASFYGKDSRGYYLDYALLELDNRDKIAEYPELIHSYSPNHPVNRGQICIVGHPVEGVKKMDPCFIIERENRQEAIGNHAAENENFIHVMTDVASKEKWDFSAYDNQITYESCFFHGASGSPVFDVDCKLIGIHTGGYKYKGGRKKVWSVMEYGFTMQPILDNIITQAKVKGFPEIVSKLEAWCGTSKNPQYQAQTDYEMDRAEEPED